jgi:hypothetical protein
MRTSEMSKVSIPVGYSALGRPIDRNYSSNVLAVGIAAGTAILFGAYNLIAAEPLASSWVEGSVGVFLAWAIGRELDPDRNISASLAMAVAFLSALAAAPSMLFSFGLLLAVRLSTGSPGVGMKWVDMVVVVVVGGLLGTAAIPFAALPAIAIGVLIVEGGSRRGMLVAGLVTLSGVLVAVMTGPWVVERGLAVTSIALVAVVVLATGLTVPAADPQSTADIGGVPLLGWRVTVSRVVAGATVLAAAFLASGSGIESAFATGGAAVVGVMAAQLMHAGDTQNGNDGE